MGWPQLTDVLQKRGIKVKKRYGRYLLLLLLILSLTGCSQIGEKAMSASAVYGAAAVLSVVMLAAYLFWVAKKNVWFLLLFSSVLVVNTGYLALSISKTLSAALFANRLSYLGSVFLPMSVLMIIMNTSKTAYKKHLPHVLIALAAVVFVVAASPGYLDIYYKEVSLSVVNGMTVLEKVYGPWHRLYLFYLMSYFVATAGVLLRAFAKKNMESAVQAFFMGATLFVNTGVWLLEQIVRIDFELLSVSYIFSELFLLMLCMLPQCRNAAETQAAEHIEASDLSAAEKDAPTDRTYEEKLQYFASQRARLTPTERAIYNLYVEGKTTKEVLAELNIKENTLKFHNKNIYGKLGVASRKQLLEFASGMDQ